MNLRQLEYLDAVAEVGSFSAAARRLHVVQPAVSQQVRKLEAELGVDLVTRSTPVRLTAAGEQVAKRARTVLNEVDAIRADATRAGEAVTGELTIGVIHWLGHVDVPAVLAAFAGRHPGVRVTLVERTTPEMLGAVRAGDLDVTFLSLLDTDERPRGARIADLGTEPLVVAGRSGSLPDSHVHLRFLHDKPFVAFAEGMNLRATVDAALAREGVVPRTVLASNEPLTVRDLVAQGLGHALLPEGLARAPGAPLDTAHVNPPGVQRRLGLAWRADRRPSLPAQAFIDTIRATSAP
jgi:LysR family transcriptional activator of glutamate synthase operon